MRILGIIIFTMSWTVIMGQSLTDSLIHSFRTNPDESLRIEAAIKLYDPLIGKYADSLYIILEDAILLAEKNNYHERRVKLEILKGQVFDQLNDYVNAQKTFLQAEKMLGNIRSSIPDSAYFKLKVSISNGIAIVFFRTGKLEDARKYYLQIVSFLEGATEKELPHNARQYFAIAYNNLGSVFLQSGDYDRAETYYLKAMTYIGEEDHKGLSSILNNLGIIEKDRGNYEKSLDYLYRSIRLRRELEYVDGEVQTLNNIGDLLWKMAETRKAKDTLEKVRLMAKENNLLRSHIIATEKLAGIYYDLGDYKSAYLAHLDFKAQYDSLMNQENLNNITQLEMQQRFEQKFREENLKREKENLLRQRREEIYLSTIIIAALVLTIIIMLYALQRSKLKRHQLTTEKDRLKSKSLELENEKLNLDLEFKNKELTTNVIYLARTNEFISGIAGKLMKHRIYFTKENQKVVDDLIREITSFSDRDTWKEFELRFQEVHKDFYNKLNEQFPDLSANEKKLCAFLRLNMTTKEISAITYQSINSITVARSRLRKKLGIDQDENLIAFLEKL